MYGLRVVRIANTLMFDICRLVAVLLLLKVFASFHANHTLGRRCLASYNLKEAKLKHHLTSYLDID